MEATEILRHEHRVALLVLAAAEQGAGEIGRGGTVPSGRLEQMLDFFRNFLDRCHHAKEERYLFPKVRRRGTEKERSLVAGLLAEHEEGRRLVRQMEEAGAETQRLARALSAYATLLRRHIDKEESRLFPAAETLLAEEDRALVEAFDQVEAAEMGEGVHERYHRLAHELAGRK